MTHSTSPDSFTVPLGAGGAVTALHYAAALRQSSGQATFICAHGAGSHQRHASITAIAHGLAALGIDVVTFNFPYTEAGRRLPDKAPVLEACYASVVAATRERVASARTHLFIGGRSMGGRMATHVAAADAALPIDGLVLLAYPFHPPGKPEKRRDAHLPLVRRPMLVVQGTRDTFGGPDEIGPVFAALEPPAEIYAVDGGDHSFKVARAGREGQAAIDDAIRAHVAAWMQRIVAASRA